MKQDEIHLVQFLHPGGECRPGPNGEVEWNRPPKPHCRKFLQQRGQFVTRPDDSSPKDNDLLFWAEWEPQSELIRPLPKGTRADPKSLLRPLFVPQASYRGLHNTDPFVFGDTFYYCVCQQRGRMKHLANGSVILFGSCLGNTFVLDTVFVVGGWQPHHRGNYKTLDVPEVYRAAGLGPLSDSSKSCAPSVKGDPLRLYHGATHRTPCHGMFSFFPCRPASESPAGFARPNICLPNVITQSQRQGLKISPPLTADEANALWNRIAKQVRQQSLRLGVSAELPSGE